MLSRELQSLGHIVCCHISAAM